MKKMARSRVREIKIKGKEISTGSNGMKGRRTKTIIPKKPGNTNR